MGDADLLSSVNAYDWLGHGIYFWEDDPRRAYSWAKANSRIEDPYVVGAIIDLGDCLSLMREDHLGLLAQSYDHLKKIHELSGTQMPKNSAGKDKLRRELDCAVINNLHRLTDYTFDSVRGMFVEGNPAYKGAGFKTKNHVQVCVRTPTLIKGYFRPTQATFE
ncbi:MAG: hypothetical protein P1U89_22825 [Verrucomicrobiales bacterium]|nr:hypothetical protein [Verrucomicrobiales bacterium]